MSPSATTPEKAIRILIADDHPVVREGLVAILALEDDLKVVGQARNGEEACVLYDQLSPDILILDLRMPRKDGLEVVTELMKHRPRPRIIVLTNSAKAEDLRRALSAGAKSYLLKGAEPEVVSNTIREVFEGKSSLPRYVERAIELAQFGLAEARRSAFSLQPTIIEELGLVQALQKLVERSHIPGRLRCNFHSTGVPEESFPASALEDLLRIAQEAMSNAVRHAKPTVISVNLRCDSPNLVLEVTDNGSGIANAEEASREGFGLSNMQARAENLGAQFEVRTAAGRGTSIVVRLPGPGGVGR